MTHPDDRFRLDQCAQCEAMAKGYGLLVAANDVLKKENDSLYKIWVETAKNLQKAKDELQSYREKERDTHYPRWYQERGSGVVK